jgi:hypothetical protein
VAPLTHNHQMPGSAVVPCYWLHCTAQVLQAHSPDASQLGVRGWSIEAALCASPLTHRPVSLAEVEARLAVADPCLWQEYQVGRGGWAVWQELWGASMGTTGGKGLCVRMHFVVAISWGC